MIRKNQQKFRCPVCNGPLTLHDSFGLACSNRHSFDLSKTGYLNLLASRSNFVYSKELFDARHTVCSKGFFDPLIDALYGIIENYAVQSEKEPIAVLDAGCGEGYHLGGLARRMGERKASLFGIDIAKEGIKIASRSDEEILWIVSDLAKLPFQKNSFDVILNILSPANYLEFERVLRRDGVVVKVIPGKHYLEELRKLIFEENTYSSDRVEDYFSNKLEVIAKQNIGYRFETDETVLPSLLKMTPLTWGEDADELALQGKNHIPSVTADFILLVGKSPEKPRISISIGKKKKRNQAE